MNLKYILLTAGLLGIAFPLSAQVMELRNNWSIGVNAGAQLNNVSFAPRVKQLQLFTPTGGFTARYISEKYFNMICGTQLEVNFSPRGWREEMDEGKTGSYYRVMNYVELPFMAHLAFGRRVQFFLNLGPQIAFLLGENEHIGEDIEVTKPQYGKMADNKFDYGIVGGGGLEVKTKPGNFLLEGRYYFGLADFYSTLKRDVFSRAAHTTISVRLTYLFDLTK